MDYMKTHDPLNTACTNLHRHLTAGGRRKKDQANKMIMAVVTCGSNVFIP